MNLRLLGAIAAVVLAVAGTVLIVAYVQDADRRALRGADPTEVYVVEKTIPAATPAQDLAGYLKKRTVPAAAVADGAITDLAHAKGKVAAVDLVPGEQLLASRLVDPADLHPPGRVPVPEGMQEVTIQLGPDRVVGGQLAAGDTVGVFSSFDDGAGTDGPTTHLLFHKVLVTSVQGAPSTQAEGEEPADAASAPPVPEGALLVTLARRAADAEKIVFTAEFGSIWLSKEPEEADERGTRVVTKDGVYR
ncbi:Flp pilus assembly protein CpaB [Arthrobacter mobilis]|uniref:Flp pilus assembly protein CpaB n=1 Tax=Arthrobacter mobilis TaxID=2724944 RepID=A0A7X6K7S7_9MICC|nr:RcpC/CpaB family pilus assembly protein [Arthrobacter mobilis]NKX56722.1 Flp pilus assembly protein CpaB [Arthrobacter mobilis]